MTIDLHVIADSYFEKSIDAVDAYFPNEAEKIAQACQAMALRFEDGGRLLAFGAGNAGTDALHLSVEFVHPVLVGKRALPAIALDRNLTSYATQIAAFGRPSDIAIGIDPNCSDQSVLSGINTAAEKGMLTLFLGGHPPKNGTKCDYQFCVPHDEPEIVQEIHETLYHILWELVHVFFKDGT